MGYFHGENGTSVAAIDLDLGHALPAGAVQYQFVPETVNRFLLKVVPTAGTEARAWEAAVTDVAQMIGTALGSVPRVELRLADRIEMNLSGKRLAFSSRLAS